MKLAHILLFEAFFYRHFRLFTDFSLSVKLLRTGCFIALTVLTYLSLPGLNEYQTTLAHHRKNPNALQNPPPPPPPNKYNYNARHTLTLTTYLCCSSAHNYHYFSLNPTRVKREIGLIRLNKKVRL